MPIADFQTFLEWKIHQLNKEVTNQEIKNAVFSMEALEAVGINGLNALFFQNQWKVVGPIVCRYVKQIFQNPKEI